MTLIARMFGRVALLVTLAFIAACGQGGGGGGGSSSTSSSGSGGTPAGSKLYYGYYVENPANNPEDPTTGGVFLRVPTSDGNFAGQMPFSFIGCTQGVDIGNVSGTRTGDSLTGNWNGTMDGTAVGGAFDGAYTAATDSFTGTYTNAAGKIQISVGACQYYVAENGTFKLFGTPTSEPSNFQAVATTGTTPTISWPSLGANVMYAVRVFDEDCLNNDPSDPACFKGETFTTGLTAAYPTAFAGASVLTAGKQYFVLVTGQDVTNGSFLGFSMLRVQPTASGGGGGGITGSTVSQLALGSLDSCALLDSGVVKCWGQWGETPNGMGNNLPAVDLGTGRTAKQISAGGGATCAILDNGSAKCWGANNWGQLGLGDTTTRATPGWPLSPGGDSLPVVSLGAGRTAKEIANGAGHTCAILDNGSVKCWGLNVFGQLGLGDTTTRGDNQNEMGDNLPAVDLGVGRTAVHIGAGTYYSCALLDNGVVKCWGMGFTWVGTGNSDPHGGNPGEMGDNLPALGLGAGRTAMQIAAGGTFLCVLLDNGLVRCWGDTGSLFWGLNPPSVDLGAGRTAVRLAAGGQHTCAILDNSLVKCWGMNNVGQLGLGDMANRGDSASQMGDNLPAVDLGSGGTAKRIGAGFNHSCAILDDDSVKCWGGNNLGQLGLGDTNNRGDNPNEMGDNLPAVDLGN